MKVTLDRAFFKDLETGDNEFDYVLGLLGIEGDTLDIDSVRFEASEVETIKEI